MNPDNLEKIFQELNAAGVRYLVVGGMAVMAHGYLRMTRDLDLVIALDGDNPIRALTVFSELGYAPNVPVKLMDFADPIKRKEWQTEKGMMVYQLVSPRLVDCPVDIFVEEPMAFSEMYPARVDYVLSDAVSIPVVGLEHLKCMKQAAGRPRDLIDLEELNQLSEATDEEV
ncbi:MAG: DUF6036 family nucleotidyltransferase [Opitutaceae bacterium]